MLGESRRTNSDCLSASDQTAGLCTSWARHSDASTLAGSCPAADSCLLVGQHRVGDRWAEEPKERPVVMRKPRFRLTQSMRFAVLWVDWDPAVTRTCKATAAILQGVNTSHCICGTISYILSSEHCDATPSYARGRATRLCRCGWIPCATSFNLHSSAVKLVTGLPLNLSSHGNASRCHSTAKAQRCNTPTPSILVPSMTFSL